MQADVSWPAEETSLYRNIPARGRAGAVCFQFNLTIPPTIRGVAVVHAGRSSTIRRAVHPNPCRAGKLRHNWDTYQPRQGAPNGTPTFCRILSQVLSLKNFSLSKRDSHRLPSTSRAFRTAATACLQRGYKPPKHAVIPSFRFRRHQRRGLSRSKSPDHAPELPGWLEAHVYSGKS